MSTAAEQVVKTLTDRQRQVWEMTHGKGEYEGNPMRAAEIAENLGISANAVYVTRRRVRTILEEQADGGERKPKRIVRQQSRVEVATRALQAELDGYKDEEAGLIARLDQIKREKPEVQKALDQLRSITGETEEVETEQDEKVTA